MVGVIVESVEDISHANPDQNPKRPTKEELREVIPAYISGSVTYGDKQKKTETIESIPIQINEVTRKEQGYTDSYFDHNYRPVPGGCEAAAKVLDGEDDGWTIGTPAVDLDTYSHVWVTAGHCINRQSNNSTYQNSSDSSHYVGDSKDYIPYEEGDAGTIDVTDSGVDATWQIASEDSDSEEYDWDIVGIVSNSRIQDMATTGEYSRFQGRRTGRDHCEVLDYFIADWEDNEGPTVKLDHYSKGGDSGCPYYELDSDGAYIMGIHAWGLEDNAAGNTIQYIENQLNISV